MRIERINDMSEVLKCLPFEREIRNKGRDDTKESDMILLIQSLIDNPLLGFWMAYDDNNNILGYLILLANPSNIQKIKRLHLLRIYAKDKELKTELERIGAEWAEQFQLKTAAMTTRNHIKAFQRMGWKVVSVNLERRI